MTKRVFLDTALEHSRSDRDDPAVRSMLAIRLGLTRRDVNAVLDSDDEYSVDTNLVRITKILSGWHTDPDFTGPYGLPLELSFTGFPDRDFVSLARRYVSDLSPQEMLEELKRIGAVKEMDQGWLKVLTRTYLPRSDTPDSLDRVGYAVQRFVETIDFNLRETEPKRRLVERTVYPDDGLRREDLPLFRNYVRERSQVLLEEIDNWLSRLRKPDVGTEGAVVHTGVGIYQYVQQGADLGPASAPDSDAEEPQSVTGESEVDLSSPLTKKSPGRGIE